MHYNTLVRLSHRVIFHQNKKNILLQLRFILSLRMIYNNDSYKTYLPYSFPLVNYKALKPNMAGFDQCLSVATCAMSRN